jgi:hypothetical protein
MSLTNWPMWPPIFPNQHTTCQPLGVATLTSLHKHDVTPAWLNDDVTCMDVDVNVDFD